MWFSSSEEASLSSLAPRALGASESVGVWLQVRDVDFVGHELEEAGVDIMELPTDKAWGLREMHIRDPDGLSIMIVEVAGDHPLRRR